jgi:hypothetical protein
MLGMLSRLRHIGEKVLVGYNWNLGLKTPMPYDSWNGKE